MIVVTLARKPLVGSVAANALKHGTGSLNIQGCRIAGPAWTWGTQTDIRGGGYGSRRPSEGDVFARNVESNPTGRWPANIVFEHFLGCEKTGTQEVPGYIINRFDDGAKPFGGGAGHPYTTAIETGPEIIDVWECVGECPVLDLDQQSGLAFSSGGGGLRKRGVGSGIIYGKYNERDYPPNVGKGDFGGASRFFKTVKR